MVIYHQPETQINKNHGCDFISKKPSLRWSQLSIMEGWSLAGRRRRGLGDVDGCAVFFVFFA